MVKGLLPPVYFLMALILMFALHYLMPGMHILPYPWILVGVLPLIAGGVLNLFGLEAFKRHNTAIRPFEEASVLVTDGIFARTRNPMYLGLVLILMGVWFLMGSLSPFLVIAAFAIAMDKLFIEAEEEMLGAIFGQEWLRYSVKVKKWM